MLIKVEGAISTPGLNYRPASKRNNRVIPSKKGQNVGQVQAFQEIQYPLKVSIFFCVLQRCRVVPSIAGWGSGHRESPHSKTTRMNHTRPAPPLIFIFANKKRAQNGDHKTSSFPLPISFAQTRQSKTPGQLASNGRVGHSSKTEKKWQKCAEKAFFHFIAFAKSGHERIGSGRRDSGRTQRFILLLL